MPPQRATPIPPVSLATTVGLLLLILLALFPSLFHYAWSIPLALLTPSTYLPRHQAATSRPCPATTTDIHRSTVSMSWTQKTFTLPSKSRGSYLVTDHVVSSVPEIKEYKVGLLNLFIQHTSCALSLNENWDEDVREDMSDALDRIAPEDRKGNLYRHSAEGLDDMPVSVYLLSAFCG